MIKKRKHYVSVAAASLQPTHDNIHHHDPDQYTRKRNVNCNLNAMRCD